MSLGRRIKQLRTEKGFTQEELGRLLNKTKNNISQYETDKRSPDPITIQNLADLFNVSTDYLLGRSNIRIPKDPDEPTPQEIEEVIRKADLQFDGAPLTEEDKEDIIGFVRLALITIKKRKREQRGDGQAPE